MSTTSQEQRAAVVGIGCRLPGGIHGPTQLWEALVEGRDLVGEIPPDRWKTMTQHLHVDQRPDHPWPAGVLEDIESFDADFFGIGQAEAAEMDAQQRLLLEVVVEALADAGIAPATLAGKRVGVYVGAASFDHATLVFTPGRRVSMHTAGGAGMAVLANRISYCLDLRGPSLSIDTACSSSLVAAHQARRDVEAGEVDLAVVAGANLLANPTITAAFVEGGVLSPTGCCKPFDASADGYVRSEGIVAVVLKPQAQGEADRVYALIAGSATNSDGRTAGLYAPSQAAQQALLERALAEARLEAGEVDYVEAHGTGTKAGDRVEGRALAAALAEGRSRQPLLVGSIKSNLGHTEGAAGLTGLVKAALALYHGQIPPTLHHHQLRPTLAEFPLRVPTQAEAWPQRGSQRVAGVSAFGFGGTNAHLLLTRPASEALAPPSSQHQATAQAVLLVSGHTPGVLAATAADYATALTQGVGLEQVAATAAHRRDHHPHRAAVVATSREQARAGLAALAQGQPHPTVVGPHKGAHPRPRVVWVFGGQGSQTPRMGADLYREPVFGQAVEETLEALAAQPGSVAGWHPAREAAPVGVAATQQALFATQVGLAALLRHWGVEVGAVVGHSLGEVAAAHTAGVLSLEDAARVVAARSHLLEQATEEGGLLAVQLGRERAGALVADSPEVALAADNGPNATVLTGPTPALAALHQHLAQEGVWAQWVPQGPRAHSPHLGPYLADFTHALTGIRPRQNRIPMVSTVTAYPILGPQVGAEYWRDQLRCPVRFREAITHLAAEQPSVFMELGPRPVLSSAINATLTHHGLVGEVVAATGEDSDETARLLHLLAQLYACGQDPTPAWPLPHGRPPAELPPPRWNHTPSTTLTAPSRVGKLAARLNHASSHEERCAAITALLATIVAESLAIPAADIDAHQPLMELGLSSIGLLEPLARLRGAHPAFAAVSITHLLAHPTIAALAPTLADMLPTAHSSTASQGVSA